MQINTALADFEQVTTGDVNLETSATYGPKWKIKGLLRGDVAELIKYGNLVDSPIVVQTTPMTTDDGRHAMATVLYGPQDGCDEVAEGIMGQYPATLDAYFAMPMTIKRYLVYNAITKSMRNYTELLISGLLIKRFGTQAAGVAESSFEVGSSTLMIQSGSKNKSYSGFAATSVMTNIFYVDGDSNLNAYVLQYEKDAKTPSHFVRYNLQEINDPTETGYPWVSTKPYELVPDYNGNQVNSIWKTNIIDPGEVADSAVKSAIATIALTNNKAVIL